VRVTHPFSHHGLRLDPARWWGPAGALAVGCVVAWVLFSFGHGAPVAVTVLLAAGVVALWNSPLRRSGHEPLPAVHGVGAAEPAVVVLWRPGCPYSSSLRRRVAREDLRVHWVNIWRDPEAHALCRRLNKGSEETPTVMLLDPARPDPVVIPASVPGIREAAGSVRG
jgi:hypothetical protein